VLPVLPLLVPALIAMVVADTMNRPDIVRTLVLLISPLWFLAVYLVLVLITPIAIRAHRRSPVVAFAGLALAAVLVDAARFGFGWSGPAMVAASFVSVWALVHQFGFVFDDLRRSSLVTRVAVAVGGIGGLAALVTFGPYPLAMVGVPGEPVSNMGPPTLAPVLLGVFQLGVVAALSTHLQSFALRHRAGLAVAGAWTMPVFVWHLLGWAVFYAALRALKVDVVAEPTAEWWKQRPIWFLGPLVVTVPLCWFVTVRPARLASPA
jgi:hypothetical protein